MYLYFKKTTIIYATIYYFLIYIFYIPRFKEKNRGNVLKGQWQRLLPNNSLCIFYDI